MAEWLLPWKLLDPRRPCRRAMFVWGWLYLVVIAVTLALLEVGAESQIISMTLWMLLLMRRLRDAGRSGLYALLIFLPVVNFGLLLYVILAPSDDPERHPSRPMREPVYLLDEIFDDR